MPTQEEYNAANVELQIANDNYAALQNKYSQAIEVLKAYQNAPAETKAKVSPELLQRAVDQVNGYKVQMGVAADRIANAQNTVNGYNNIIAQQQAQAQQQAAGQRRRTIVPPTNDGHQAEERWQPIYNSKGEIVGQQRVTPEAVNNASHRNSVLKNAASNRVVVPNETRQDIYNSGGWNELVKGFNNTLVDEAVLPIASSLGASDDTLGILSELKMPATEREKASKYYAYGGGLKDTADAILQYETMRGLETIPGLFGVTKAATPNLVANGGRGIYNTPSTFKTVKYAPAYMSKAANTVSQPTSAAAKFANGRQIPENLNKTFWKYANGIGQNVPIQDAIGPFLK